MKNLSIFLFLILLGVSCRKQSTDQPLSCVDQYIQDHHLLKYTGQDLGCHFYVQLYELDGKEYFLTDCPCADMFSIPKDCSGVPYCDSLNTQAMTYFSINAVPKKIVGLLP